MSNSGKTTLIYDAKCPLCSDLARKIHHHARIPVEILALSDPAAIELLRSRYPHGWEHDFYLFENGTCRKGVRSLGRLRSHLGTRQLTALIAEYSHAKVTSKRLAVPHEHVDGEVVGTGRRNVLKGAALGAIAVPLAGMPRLASAFEQPSPSYVVNFAEGQANGSGAASVRAWANTGALRKTAHFTRKAEHAQGKLDRLDERNLLDAALPQLGTARIDSAKLVKERQVDGKTEHRSMVTFSASLDAPRYQIGLFAGYGDLDSPDGVIQGATTAVGIRHDLAAPVADVATMADGASQPLAGHFDVYRASIGEFRGLHAKDGREEFVHLYGELEQGFTRLADEFLKVIPETYRPVKNRMVISATPEILKFVEYPAAFSSVVPMGCDCSCSCGACCAVGCGLGLCIPPKPCGPGCCISCGCGCGCCL
ncbi:hypothetical protein L3Q67_43450 [Saccharothrix sp. AJ9571]|nr:hypothetical protein L3Q67_43450 [Saccharothrix sp. AJ9571]